MRITFAMGARVKEAVTGREVSPPAWLDGAALRATPLDFFMDENLIDEGIVGGTMRLAVEEGERLRLFVDFSIADTLDEEVVSDLESHIAAQMTEGPGAEGFPIEREGVVLLVFGDPDFENVEINQVDDGPPVRVPYQLPTAARAGDLNKVRRVLNEGKEPVDSPRCGNSALHFALRFGHLEIALLLLKHGANPNLTNQINDIPMAECVSSHRLNDQDATIAAEALIQAGAKPPGSWAELIADAEEARKPKLAAYLKLLPG